MNRKLHGSQTRIQKTLAWSLSEHKAWNHCLASWPNYLQMDFPSDSEQTAGPEAHPVGPSLIERGGTRPFFISYPIVLLDRMGLLEQAVPTGLGMGPMPTGELREECTQK